MDRILAVIPVHNRRETTLAILKSLQKLRAADFQLDVLVIDDGSTDGTVEAVVARFPGTAIVRGDGKLWWGGALNVGFRYTLERGYDYVYTLNDDIVLREDTLDELHKAARTLRDAVCCSVITGDGGRIIAAGYTFSRLLRKLRNPRKNQAYDSLGQDILPSETLSTQSTLMPVAVLRKGLFIDAKRFPHNYSDLDYFDTVRRQGFRLAVVRRSIVQADESSSNYHLFILNKAPGEILRTFLSVKYAHNLRTQWNMALKKTNPALGAVRFAGRMTPYVFWLALRLLLPKHLLARLLATGGRIPEPDQGGVREKQPP